MLKIIKWSAVAVVFLGAIFVFKLTVGKPFNIDHFFGRAFLFEVLKSPEALSQLRLLEQFGIKSHQDDLDDASMAAQDESYLRLADNVETLNSYDDEDLTDVQLLSKQVLNAFLSDQVEGEEWRYHNYPVNQLFGIQNSFPSFMESAHAIEEIGDAEDYISRLSKVDTKFDQVLEGLKHRESIGVIPPRFVIERVLDEMNGFIGAPIDENILIVSLTSKLDKLESIDQPKKDELLTEAKAVYQSDVVPAYKLFIDYFSGLMAKATTDDGVWKLPNGDDYYAYAVRHHTTTDYTPDQIHEIGLKEVDRIQAEILAILQGEGYSKDLNFTDAVAKMAADPKFYYPDTDEGREQILADYTAMIKEIEAGLDDWFDIRPQAPVEVKRIPEFKEKSAPGAYYNGPALDGSRPGIFYANLYDIKATPKYSMRTLAYHEAVPGHHFQIAIQQELKGLPMFRNILGFTAYAEGWALYTELVAKEAGFQENPYDDIGRLQAELFRAVRLVVDTGLHKKRWTREEAIDYMVKNTGMVLSDVTAEIERYIVMPGQACAYKVGMLKILELRQKAKDALGEKFDIREFHNVVLQNGSIPLTILEQEVDKYIKQQSI